MLFSVKETSDVANTALEGAVVRAVLVEKGLVCGDHLGHGIVIYWEADLPVTAREKTSERYT